MPSPNGKISPSINNVELLYKIDYPPRAPIFPEVTDAGDSYVRLRWKKNVEHDVGGYRIYYGIRSGIFDGMIGYIEGKRITNNFNSYMNYIEVEITNNIINENRIRDHKRVLEYPALKNTVLYFFSVSVYDSYKIDTLHNHESEPSREVSSRPFAGSEITSNH